MTKVGSMRDKVGSMCGKVGTMRDKVGSMRVESWVNACRGLRKCVLKVGSKPDANWVTVGFVFMHIAKDGVFWQFC